jgi:hypothetical protein
VATTNLERVGKALVLVRDGLRPQLEKVWRAKYGAGWIETVNKTDNMPDRKPSPDDLSQPLGT